MAVSNANLLQTNKPFSLPLLAVITIFLMLLNRVNSSSSLSFSFDRFDADQMDLILQGDATVKNNALQLTKTDSSGNPVGGSVGRALYSAPVRLSEGSRTFTSFQASFTFQIASQGSNTPADGLAFFLASHDTTIPRNSGGAFLGLFSNTSFNEIVFRPGSDQVVAVEFDTYPNTNIGDPDYQHIGIDINSIRSSAHSRWNLQSGRTATAHISYNSAAKRLSVVSLYPNSEPVTVSYDVDLKNHLPESVRVGFSAATGQYRQVNNILSWSFSILNSNDIKVEDMYLASYV